MQDAFLHWHADRQWIKVPEAWLTKVITNLCLDGTRPAGRADGAGAVEVAGELVPLGVVAG
ncbi:hypothetical protein ACWEPL_31100 [Nonomuraea sp. NPDC004186]